jgi:hypothetical protein
MGDDDIILGQLGTAEENAAYARWRAEQIAENNRRIAAGQYGDVPDELTEEDEAILDCAWKEIAQEDEQQKQRRAAARKRRICPTCKSKNTARILYGEIILTEKLSEQSQRGKIVFGGCCESNESPNRQCNDCGTSFSTRAARYPKAQ